MTSSLLSPHAVSFTPTSRPASPSTQATNDPIESNSGAFVSLKQSKSSPSNGAVPLPKRDLPQTVETRPPVWSLTRGEETEQTAEAPLAALCQQHERANQVCCRTLKGDDERHLIDPDIVRDLIIGLSDGFCVPFALTAGMAALNNSKLVIVAGMAELLSGAISMGVGGFLSAEAEQDHYKYLKAATHARVQRSCAGEMEREVHEILGPLGVNQSISRRVSSALRKAEDEFCPPSTASSDSGSDESWMRGLMRKMARTRGNNRELESLLKPTDKLEVGKTDVGVTAFLLKFGEGLEDVPTSRLWISAITIGSGYFVGGLLPILPYFFIASARTGLYASIALTAVVLLIFGCFKAYYTGQKLGFSGYAKGALSTMLVGGAAAAASFGLVKALDVPM